jgi:hypothetical protein
MPKPNGIDCKDYLFGKLKKDYKGDFPAIHQY